MINLKGEGRIWNTSPFDPRPSHSPNTHRIGHPLVSKNPQAK
jgi:hypothetical protein